MDYIAMTRSPKGEKTLYHFDTFESAKTFADRRAKQNKHPLVILEQVGEDRKTHIYGKDGFAYMEGIERTYKEVYVTDGSALKPYERIIAFGAEGNW